MRGREKKKSRMIRLFFISKLAEPTGFEPATSDVTGSKSKPEIWLSYTNFSTLHIQGIWAFCLDALFMRCFWLRFWLHFRLHFPCPAIFKYPEYKTQYYQSCCVRERNGSKKALPRSNGRALPSLREKTNSFLTPPRSNSGTHRGESGPTLVRGNMATATPP
jgi:hypothetical protein